MSKRPLDALKTVAEEYANLILNNSSDRARIEFLRKELGMEQNALNASHADSKKLPIDDGSIGIWSPTLVNGQKYYVRDKKYSYDFTYWANVREIPPKSDKYRVAFLGESVARGFLYDPYFTPAAYLQALLDENSNDTGFEVVDLARVSIGMEDLRKLAVSCSALEPDAIVVFAGNNWRKSFYPLSESECEEYNRASEEDDRFDRVESILNRKMQKLISDFMSSLKDINKKLNIPIIFIIPEFNLKDWRSNSIERILSWSNGSTGKWLELKSRAEAALKEGDTAQAEELGYEMVALNRSNPEGYELLAQIKLKSGMYQEARRYFELGRDTCVFRMGPPPMCTSFIREEILRQAPGNNITIIDLPAVFNEYLSGDIPGNDLFIDYCHLTIEGIRIAMKCTAEALLALKNERLPLEEISMVDVNPGSDVIGKAHFYAAVHSAHMGQPYELLHYHCVKALEASEKAAALMKSYIDMATKKVPWAFNKNFEVMFTDQYSIIRQLNDCRIMDYELVCAMLAALESIGINLREETDMLRVSEHKPNKNKSVDLTETYYRESCYYNAVTPNQSRSYDNQNQCYISTKDVKASFFLIADRENDIKLDLTYRTPVEGLDIDNIKIRINENMLSEKAASKNWADLSVVVPKDMLYANGINFIEIVWPLIDRFEKEIKKEYEKKYTGFNLIVQKSRPVLGEILRFNASVV